MERNGLIGQDRGRVTERRRTNGRACLSCHQRKVRCDALQVGTPCSNCRMQDRSGCRMYGKFKSTRRAPAHHVSRLTVPPRSQMPNKPPPPSSPSQIVDGGGSDRASERENGENPTGPAAVSSTEAAPLTEGLASSDAQLDATNPDEHDGRDGHDDLEVDEGGAANLADFVNQDNIGPVAIGIDSRLYFLGTETSNLHFLVRQRMRNAGQEKLLHFSSRQLERKHTTYNCGRMPADVYVLPSRELADSLVEAYFLHVNRGWPIVDEEDFLTRYYGRDRQNPPALTLLHAILLVGAHSLAASRPELLKMKQAFYRRAKSLFDARFEQDRTMHVQVALLLTWYSDGVEDVLANAWHWAGIAARIAQGLGMHRDSSQSGLLPVYKRTWVRLWWILVQFDVLTSLFHGRPQAIDLDDSDVPLLNEGHFVGITHAHRQFMTYHTSLCTLVSRLVKQKGCFKSSVAFDPVKLREADRELAHFSASLPDAMRLSMTDRGDTWQFALHLTHAHLLILLHRQLPTSDNRFTEDMEICRDAGRCIISISDSLRARGKLSSVSIFGINAIFTALVQTDLDLDSPNPVFASNALQNHRSLLQALRSLSGQWLYAKSIISIYERRPETDRPLREIESSNRPEVGITSPNHGDAVTGPQSVMVDSYAPGAGNPVGELTDVVSIDDVVRDAMYGPDETDNMQDESEHAATGHWRSYGTEKGHHGQEGLNVGYSGDLVFSAHDDEALELFLAGLHGDYTD